MILEQARELGLALAATPEYAKMCEAQRAVEQSEALSALMREFQDKQKSLLQILSDGNAERAAMIELSTDIERLREQLAESPQFSEMVAAEKAFSDLVHAVDAEVNACIGGTSSFSQQQSCDGTGCANCRGCAH